MPCARSERQGIKIGLAETDAPSRGAQDASEQHGDLASAAIRRPDQGSMLPGRNRETDRVDPADPIFVDIGHGFERDIAATVGHRPGHFITLEWEHQRGVEQTPRLKAPDHLFVTNSAVLLSLVEVEELPPEGFRVA